MGNDNLTTKEEISIENLYNFIRASLVALQPTDWFGEADFTCPICGSQAHIKRVKGKIYNNGDIECQCGYSFHF
ncbi:hypothetical protein [Enterocloster clostridioformis]|uniref:Uncharacterized protein n=1 Tax=Enterocloster clostridioformis TaxID=1531 RepID=A0A1I0JNS0_9FIRM|nr:hypothetical protein [Enterocloster clostridioformis]SEU11429.1 hypothetical protein SAMN05216521_106135 [Enterocloster clostridioformis]SEW46722.1 hypothetical protein SAMN05216528_10591 [Enterocloster clostridioformis]